MKNFLKFIINQHNILEVNFHIFIQLAKNKLYLLYQILYFGGAKDLFMDYLYSLLLMHVLIQNKLIYKDKMLVLLLYQLQHILQLYL